MASLKNSKAAGHDEIPIRFLKAIGLYISDHLTHFFNFCLMNGIFPDRLKIARVVPILKGGDKSILGNYRPISVLSCIATVFEKLIQARLISFLETNSLLSTKQFGFRSGLDTNQAMLDVVDKYYHTMDRNCVGCSIFLDLKKAFDTVDHSILIYKLSKIGIRGTALDLFKDYLLRRYQSVDISNSKSSFQPITCGVPQGSVLGPTLFLIYINDIVNASSFQTTLFADDTHLFASAKNITELQNIVNCEMVNICAWLHSNKLSINPSKTKLLLINNHVHRGINFNIRLHNATIYPNSEAKYLGVLIDNNLSWKAHVELLVSKLSRGVGVLFRLSNFLPSDTLRMLYFSLVHSHLRYGILLWGFSNKSLLYRLQILQNKAIRSLSRTSRYTNMKKIFKSLRILRVAELRDFELAKFMYYHFHGLLSSNFHFYFKSANIVHGYNTRFASTHSYFVPSVTREKCKNSVKFAGVRIWNAIPENIRNQSLRCFKISLIDYILNSE